MGSRPRERRTRAEHYRQLICFGERLRARAPAIVEKPYDNKAIQSPAIKRMLSGPPLDPHYFELTWTPTAFRDIGRCRPSVSQAGPRPPIEGHEEGRLITVVSRADDTARFRCAARHWQPGHHPQSR